MFIKWFYKLAALKILAFYTPVNTVFSEMIALIDQSYDLNASVDVFS